MRRVCGRGGVRGCWRLFCGFRLEWGWLCMDCDSHWMWLVELDVVRARACCPGSAGLGRVGPGMLFCGFRLE